MGHDVSAPIDDRRMFLEFSYFGCDLSTYSGVEGHFDHHPHGRGWVKIQDYTTPLLAELVGG
jgi:hypothetical protein